MFDQLPTPFTLKTFNKLGIEGSLLNLIKGIYEKPTIYIILNGEDQKLFSKIRNKRKISALTMSG